MKYQVSFHLKITCSFHMWKGRSPLLWLHDISCLSQKKVLKVKWFGIFLVFIIIKLEHHIANWGYRISLLEFRNRRRDIFISPRGHLISFRYFLTIILIYYNIDILWLQYMYAFNIVPMVSIDKDELIKQPPDVTEFPYKKVLGGNDVSVAKSEMQQVRCGQEFGQGCGSFLFSFFFLSIAFSKLVY